MEKTQKRKIEIKGKTIEYILTRKKVKNINLRINAKGIINISANKNVPIKYIEEFIISNTDFILKNLDYLSKLPKPEIREYITGEEISFLGQNLTLEVVNSDKEDVTIEGEKLFLYTNFTDDIDVRIKLLNKFYSKKCVEVFTEIINEIYPTFEKMGIEYPTVKMRKMKSRWGSCMPGKNQINLNTKLIEKPRECIEYVVLHEFCHFIHPNHSKDYYRFVESLMPDWEERRKELNRR